VRWTHIDIGYTDFLYLAPVYLAAVFYVLGAALTYPYLCHANIGSRKKTAKFD
jgi:hypothetical protein